MDTVHLQVTEEQMWSAGKLMRDVCLPKYPKVSVEVADNIRNGDIPNSKDTNCYINCILEMMQAVRIKKFPSAVLVTLSAPSFRSAPA